MVTKRQLHYFTETIDFLHEKAILKTEVSPDKVLHIVKPVLSGHSKIDKMKTGGSLMQVKSIAWSILQYCLEHSAILLTCIKR